MRNAWPPEEEWLTPKGRLTRARIVDAAADLFAQHGIAGTSLEDVRRTAGVSGSQITHYFSGKQGLVRAVLHQHAEAALESLRPPGSGRFETLSDLRSWADGAAGWQGPGRRFGMIAGELVQPDPETQAELARCFGRWAAVLGEAIEELRHGGVLRQDANPEALAYGLLAAFHGGMLMTRAVQSSAPLEAAMSAMLAYIASLRPDSRPTGPEDGTVLGPR